MILIIDNYDSFTYNLFQTVAQFEPELLVFRNNRITIDEIKKLNPDGIILSPGPGRPEQAGICIELIREFYRKKPILGVCLGHQAIGAAFGAKIVQAPEIVHGKHELIFHYRHGIYEQLPLPFQAGRYHSLLVERTTLPSSLIVEAESAGGLVMGMRHVTLPIYGVQFHPESILTPQGDRLLQNFVLECTRKPVNVCC